MKSLAVADRYRWKLTPEQVGKLDEASTVTAPYSHSPHRRQEGSSASICRWKDYVEVP